MLWEAARADPDKKALAMALIERVRESGWRRSTLSAASEATFSDATRWKNIFPSGPRDAIWYISEVSDASMRLPFSTAPAPSMSAVIDTRLSQNAHLKLFVRRVMLFDMLHPVQALARMQRTSRAMFGCLQADKRSPSRISIAILNLVYTAIVVVWLFDRTDDNALTCQITRQSMRVLGHA